jgi:ATP-dependent Clp protease protease subunit
VEQQVKRKFWNFIKKDASSGELQLYGEIADSTWWGDEVTPKDFKADLDALGDISTLDVYINSPGGDVFAGQAIYSMLKRCKSQVNVYVDGLAASSASLVAMAGDKITMPENAMMMIHNAWTIVQGNANDLRKQAEAMDKVDASIKTAYLAKAPDLTDSKLTEMMDAETWLSAQDAVDLGLADEIEDAKDYAASLRGRLFDSYRHVPNDLPERAKKTEPVHDKEKIRQLKAKLSLELAL